MKDKKLIAAFGATGAQGGGLVRSILREPDGAFSVRAITRDRKAAKARALADAGADVVEADLDDTDSLVGALRGAHGAFAITNFWEHFSPEKEQSQARNLVQAARLAKLKHVVWSTLEDTRLRVPLADDRMPTLLGRYKVPHFDGKGEADAYFAEAGIPTTYLRTSFYWENLIHFGMGPKPGEGGVLQLVLPMGEAKLPGIAAEDIGRCAHGVFKADDACIGRTVGIAGEHLDGAQIAAALTRAMGREVRYAPVTPQVYRGFGFPGADDLGNMFQYKQEFEAEFRAVRDVRESRRLNPQLQGFAEWLRENVTRIPV